VDRRGRVVAEPDSGGGAATLGRVAAEQGQVGLLQTAEEVVGPLGAGLGARVHAYERVAVAAVCGHLVHVGAAEGLLDGVLLEEVVGLVAAEDVEVVVVAAHVQPGGCAAA